MYFNTSHVTVQHVPDDYSDLPFQFQYISCYCSTFYFHFLPCNHSYFNTSHVTVQLLMLTENIVLLHISIHLMLLFNGIKQIKIRRSKQFQYISCYCSTCRNFNVDPQQYIFQYISCYCSTEIGKLGGIHIHNFNTSHVTVQHTRYLEWTCEVPYFNTSHVTVQLLV